MSALSARCLLNACLFLVSLFSVALLACLFTQFFQRSLPTLASHAISYLNSHLKKRVHNEFFACLNSLLQKWAIFAEETWRVLGSCINLRKTNETLNVPLDPKHTDTRGYMFKHDCYCLSPSFKTRISAVHAEHADISVERNTRRRTKQQFSTSTRRHNNKTKAQNEKAFWKAVSSRHCRRQV